METLQRTANRGSISTGYDIDNSCKFEDDNDEWLYRTNASGTNRKTWTVSWWFKQTELRSANGAATEHWQGGVYGEATRAGIFADDRIWIDIGGGDGNAGTLFRSLSTQKIRDTSAWYHIVIACDSTQSTEADRLKVWLNGVEVTAWDQKQYPTLNYQSALQGTGGVQMKWGSADATYHGYSGYLAECHYLDGVTKVQTDFGEFDDDSGIWKPKEYTGTYGTNGTYLDFADASDLGDDESGNGNDYTENNITAADQATDTPTNNFCTLFPPPAAVTGTAPSIKEGGTTMFGGVSSSQNAFGTMGVRSGKWYFESTITDDGGVATSNHNFGVIDPEQITYVMTSGRDIGASPAGWACSSNSLPRNNNAAASGANATGALNENEIMGVAIDMDNGKIWWHRQGTWTSISSTAGDPANGTTPAFSNLLTATDNFVIPAGGYYVNDGNQARAMNFGGYAQAVFTAVGTYADANGYGSFAYQPPSGYYALCTKNLAEYG